MRKRGSSAVELINPDAKRRRLEETVRAVEQPDGELVRALLQRLRTGEPAHRWAHAALQTQEESRVVLTVLLNCLLDALHAREEGGVEESKDDMTPAAADQLDKAAVAAAIDRAAHLTCTPGKLVRRLWHRLCSRGCVGLESSLLALPDDLWSGILSFLPARAAMKLQSVSPAAATAVLRSCRLFSVSLVPPAASSCGDGGRARQRSLAASLRRLAAVRDVRLLLRLYEDGKGGDAAVFAALRGLPQLRRLKLRMAPSCALPASLLAAALPQSQLVALDVASVGLCGDMRSFAAALARCPKLQRLRMSEHAMGQAADYVIQRLRACGELVECDLSGNGDAFPLSALHTLARALPCWPRLTTLCLASLELRTLQPLADVFEARGCALQEFNVEDNAFTADGLRSLDAILKHARAMRRLSIGKQELFEDDYAVNFPQLFNSCRQLQLLDLSASGMTAAQWDACCAGLRKLQMRRIVLSNNVLPSASSVHTLVDALSASPSLRCVSIGGCSLSSRHAPVVASLLCLPTVTSLDISGLPCMPRVLEEIAAGIGSDAVQTLRSLDCSAWRLSGDRAAVLLQLLSAFPNLTLLRLNGCHLTADVLSLVARHLPWLRELHVWDNPHMVRSRRHDDLPGLRVYFTEAEAAGLCYHHDDHDDA